MLCPIALLVNLQQPAWHRPQMSGGAPPGSVVARHGQLRTNRNQLVDKNGEPVQLRGMSLFWSVWGQEKYWNKQVVEWLVSDWKVSIIRCAMAVEPEGGYLEKPGVQKRLVETVVDAAIDLGIYAIIDWHDHNATHHAFKATNFFRDMAMKFGRHPNVLFEPFNEPTLDDWSTELKPYFKRVISAIRVHSTNVIILGTRTWSQEVDVASMDPLEGDNLAYTLHFYAASHKQSLRDKAMRALANNITLFTTEWGTCDYSGNGTLDFGSARTWLDFLDSHNISSLNWAIDEKYESCAALWPGASTSGGWLAENLTFSGEFMRNALRDEEMEVLCSAPGWPCVKPPCAAKGMGCKEERCCSAPGQTCFEKNGGWAQCMETCTIEERPNWSCKSLEMSKPPVLNSNWMSMLTPIVVLLIVALLVFLGLKACGIIGRAKKSNADDDGTTSESCTE